jgi:hypothetical protein
MEFDGKVENSRFEIAGFINLDSFIINGTRQP